ncbi:MAG: tetratricopeptide repeat protein [Bacteroidales bacterium]|jgi:tetratricopeptide (TPR) repeat protein|nr:tetratricopeptide repeat protein [Bacteroidales bacterium]
MHIFKKLFFSLLIVLLSVFAHAQTDDFNNQALSIYLDAENAFMAEDYSKAFSLYQEVLKTDKEFDPAMFQLARIYLVRNQIDEAYKWANEAYKRDQENEMYALLLVDIHKHFNKFKEAIEVYKKLLISDSTNSDYLNGLSQLYMLTQNTEAAISIYNQLEMQEGVNERLSFIKKDLYLNSGNFDKAILEMVKLSEKYPENSQYISMIAEMYMGNKDTENAFMFYQKVLDINPDDPYIRITLADFYQQKGEVDLAFENLHHGYANPKLDLDTKIQVLKGLFELKNIPEERIRKESLKLASTLTKVHPDKPGSHAIYADMLYRDSLYTEAAREYNEVIKLDSSRYAVWEQLLFSLNNRTETKKITTVSQRAINLFPKEPIPYLFNAIGHFVEDSIKMAIQSLEQGIPLVQNTKLLEQYFMYLGDAYYQNDQSDKAFEAYDKCLEINPSNTFVLNNYAYYLAIKKQKLDKAKTMAFTAISLDPGPTNLDTYGWVLYQLGNYDEAFKYIDRAIKEEKNPSPEVLDHMGDVFFQLGQENKAKRFWKKAKKGGLDTPEFNHKLANGL